VLACVGELLGCINVAFCAEASADLCFYAGPIGRTYEQPISSSLVDPRNAWCSPTINPNSQPQPTPGCAPCRDAFMLKSLTRMLW
jgi:hypothetical protein